MQIEVGGQRQKKAAISQDCKLHQLDLCHCALDNLETETTDFHDLIKLGKTLIKVQDKATDRFIIIIFRQTKIEHIIHLVNLQARRQEIFIVAHLLGNIFLAVVFIFDIAEFLEELNARVR